MVLQHCLWAQNAAVQADTSIQENLRADADTAYALSGLSNRCDLRKEHSADHLQSAIENACHEGLYQDHV